MGAPPEKRWTKEMTIFALKGAGAGASAGEIADAMNSAFKWETKITRSAVIGRLGRVRNKDEPRRPAPIGKRKGNGRNPGSHRPKRKPEEPPVAAPHPQPQPEDVLETLELEHAALRLFGPPVPLLQVKGCRWPAGDPVLFCNARRYKRYSYCRTHCRVAYNGPLQK
jgi:hypothetical protein